MALMIDRRIEIHRFALMAFAAVVLVGPSLSSDVHAGVIFAAYDGSTSAPSDFVGSNDDTTSSNRRGSRSESEEAGDDEAHPSDLQLAVSQHALAQTNGGASAPIDGTSSSHGGSAQPLNPPCRPVAITSSVFRERYEHALNFMQPLLDQILDPPRVNA